MRDTFETSRFPAKTGVYRPNLNYEVERVGNEGEKQLSLVRLLRENEGAGIVYAATIREVKAVADYLKRIGFNVAPYHGQLGAGEQRGNRDRFMAGGLKVIVATSDCGPDAGAPSTSMDIDKSDIRFAIHYNMPMSLEAYYQESSRAGRDGRTARCTLLFQVTDRRQQLFLISGRSPKPEEVVAVYETLGRLNADLAPAPLEQIQTSVSGAPRTKVRAILSLLKNMGFIKEHRGARYTLLKRDLSEQEMRQMAGEYTSKDESAREKLERMTMYAQSPECRWKLILEYLGSSAETSEGPSAGLDGGLDMELKACGHCDNCWRPAVEQAHTPESLAKPDFIDLLFAYHQQEEARIRPGDVVKLPAHGEVRVKAVEGDKIVVSLPGGETRKFKREWVIR